MNKKQRLYIILLIISVLYLLTFVIDLYLKGILFNQKLYSIKFIFLGLAAVILLSVLFVLEEYDVYKKIKSFSINVHIIEASLIAILIISLSVISGMILEDHYILSQQKQKNDRSIGIYLSESNEPLNFSGGQINNPVLTKYDISDTKADFIADPFLIYENSTFYMFFEVFNSITTKGQIGLAESNDGINWSYKQIVLNEPFHLAYPCVFKYNNDYYMIPDTGEIRSVRLYKANNFPYNWSYEKTIIDGWYLVDSTIFYYNGIWWLFTQSFIDSSLHLFFSDSPLDIWTEHSQSPVISQDQNISRPGGNVIIYNNQIYRYTQDNYLSYGIQVWVFEITTLTRDDYKEKRVGNTPILKGFNNWNKLGMHHISICRIDDKWIAAVDGFGRV